MALKEARAILGVVRGALLPLLLGLIVGVAGGLLWSLLTPPRYRATATIMIEQYRPAALDWSSATTGDRLTNTYAQLLQARPILSATISALGLATDVSTLSRHVQARALRDTQLVELIVDDPLPEGAVRIAAAILDEFGRQNAALQATRFAPAEEELASKLLAAQQALAQTGVQLSAAPTSSAPAARATRTSLESKQASYQQTINALQAQLEGVRAAGVQPLVTTMVVEPPQANSNPADPNILANIALGALVGIFLAGLFLSLKYHLAKEVEAA